jgi:formate hydrogenlyase subunit 6/NADH:ubiquinone oxidoreductase subunit I
VTITCIAGGVGLCPISAIAKSENKIVAIKKENTSNLKRVDLTAILESIKPISMVNSNEDSKSKSTQEKSEKKSYQSRI